MDKKSFIQATNDTPTAASSKFKGETTIYLLPYDPSTQRFTLKVKSPQALCLLECTMKATKSQSVPSNTFVVNNTTAVAVTAPIKLDDESTITVPAKYITALTFSDSFTFDKTHRSNVLVPFMQSGAYFQAVRKLQDDAEPAEPFEIRAKDVEGAVDAFDDRQDMPVTLATRARATPQSTPPKTRKAPGVTLATRARVTPKSTPAKKRKAPGDSVPAASLPAIVVAPEASLPAP